MFERINLETKYKGKPIAEVSKIADQLDDVAAVNEYLLRSIFSGIPADKVEVRPRAAFNLAERYLKINPEHLFSNLVVAAFELRYSFFNDFVRAKNCLAKVINSKDKVMLNPALFLQLITWEENLADAIDKMVSVSQSIIGSSTITTKKLLDGCLFNPKYRPYSKNDDVKSTLALNESVFMAIILSGVKFHYFDNSTFVNQWDVQHGSHFIAANKSIQPVQDLDDETSDVAWLLNDAIVNDHEIALNFFKRCKERKVISDDLYFKILNFFIAKTQDALARDNLTYGLFLHYANKYQLTEARQYLGMLSAKFTGFKISDLTSLAPTQQFELAYRRFKQLYNNRSYDEAILILDEINKIQACAGYDADAFNVFVNADPYARNFKYFEIQRKLALKILEHGDVSGEPKNIVTPELKAYADIVYMEDLYPLDKVFRCMFKDMLRQVDVYSAERRARMEKEPHKNWGREQEREQFYAEMQALSRERSLTDDSYKPSQNEWTALRSQFAQVITSAQSKLASRFRELEINKLFVGLNLSLRLIDDANLYGWNNRPLPEYKNKAAQTQVLPQATSHPTIEAPAALPSAMALSSAPEETNRMYYHYQSANVGAFTQSVVLPPQPALFYNPADGRYYYQFLDPVYTQPPLNLWQQSPVPQLQPPLYQPPVELAATLAPAAIQQQVQVLQPEVVEPVAIQAPTSADTLVPMAVPPAKPNVAAAKSVPPEVSRYAVPADALDANGSVKGFEGAAQVLMPSASSQTVPAATQTMEKSDLLYELNFPFVPPSILPKQSLFAQQGQQPRQAAPELKQAAPAL